MEKEEILQKLVEVDLSMSLSFIQMSSLFF